MKRRFDDMEDAWKCAEETVSMLPAPHPVESRELYARRARVYVGD